jgi:hypothetical protein
VCFGTTFPLPKTGPRLERCILPHPFRSTVFSQDATGSLEAEEAVTPEWRGTQAVRGRSAKPFIAGSIPARASTLYKSLKSLR